ncbi:MAG: hypothetical protein LBP67_03820 [Bacteroidales bacterium]|jgi:hypothetical protein|nr:hypothetical protein [Bacteroidales bacterium]
MKLKKLLSALLFAVFIFSLTNIFDKNESKYSGDFNSSSELGTIYDNSKDNYEDLLDDYLLTFSCVDNSPNFNLQTNFNQNYIFARKNQQDKSYNLNVDYDEFIAKLAGLSRFDLSFAALNSKHVLCYIFLFCRILT